MTGKVLAKRPLESGVRLSIEHGYGPLALGESIAVSGACLTVAAQGPTWFEIDASTETLEKTTLGQWELGHLVNLERALALGDRLGGHLVTGHVDGLGEVLALDTLGEMTRLRVALPAELARYVAKKGSLCLDGVSLTVNDVKDEPSPARADLLIIPHTRQHTTLGRLAVGSRVNLEIDLLARYIERLQSSA